MKSYAIIALAGLVSACGPSTPPTNNGSTTGEPSEAEQRRQAALVDIASKVVIPAYEVFAVEARELASAVDAFASSGEDADRDAARVAWRDAMIAWQSAEVLGFGPAGVAGNVEGGADLRDAIYSWPTINPCRVDQEIVEGAYEDPEAFRAETVNVRGLDALEYLLHHEGAENQCDPTRGVNADGSWAALDADALATRRREYARTLADNLVDDADALVAAWNDGFETEFTTAGSSSETYATAQSALNAVTDALFYVEQDVKDMKLAEPIGIMNCAESVCPEALEFQWADANYAAISANLVGARALFTGADGVGFDDLLTDAGQEQLSEDMLAALDVAQESAASKTGTLREDLQGDRDGVVALHADVKGFTDLLKTQFIGVLDLELPMRAEGDND